MSVVRSVNKAERSRDKDWVHMNVKNTSFGPTGCYGNDSIHR